MITQSRVAEVAWPCSAHVTRVTFPYGWLPLVLSQFRRFLEGFHRALNKSHLAFRELSESFQRAFNERHPTFIVVPWQPQIACFPSIVKKSLCCKYLQIRALWKLWGNTVTESKQPLPPWSIMMTIMQSYARWLQIVLSTCNCREDGLTVLVGECTE